jgi:uncharacterized RDD family membrane protein YckC
MKPAGPRFPVLTHLLVAVAVCACAVHAATPTSEPSLAAVLAHGTSERLWVAGVETGGADGPQTVLVSRAATDTRWRRSATLAGRAVGLTSRRSELAVLLDNGQWLLVSDSGARGGPPLPNGASIRALAGSERGLFAVGLSRQMPVTRPSTTSQPVERAASARVTAPTTGPAQLYPTLYSLSGSGWVVQGPAPASALIWPVLLAGPELLLGGVDGLTVRFWSWGSDQTWHDAGSVTLPELPAGLQLLMQGDQPLLYATGISGDGLIWRHESGAWLGPVYVQRGLQSPSGQCAVAWALGDLRRVCLVAAGEPIEQVIGLHGDTVGAARQIPGPPARVDPRIMQAVHLMALLLVGWVMVMTLRRKQGIREAIAQADRSRLAPVWLRIAAGLLDATPIIAAGFILEPEPSQRELPRWLMVLAGAGAIYVLHTTLSEVLTGRTIGKALFGLRVVALDGGRPTVLAMVTRNLLRPLDILTLMPLVMILLSPLHQRMGDLAAGTMVVRSRSGPEAS